MKKILLVCCGVLVSFSLFAKMHSCYMDAFHIVVAVHKKSNSYGVCATLGFGHIQYCFQGVSIKGAKVHRGKHGMCSMNVLDCKKTYHGANDKTKTLKSKKSCKASWEVGNWEDTINIAM